MVEYSNVSERGRVCGSERQEKVDLHMMGEENKSTTNARPTESKQCHITYLDEAGKVEGNH